MADDAVNIDQVIFPVDGVENSPVLDRIFGKARQVRRDRFVAQVIDVGGDPFGLIQESLCHGWLKARKILEDDWAIGKTIPGHAVLPAETELVRNVLAGQSFFTGQGLF